MARGVLAALALLLAGHSTVAKEVFKGRPAAIAAKEAAVTKEEDKASPTVRVEGALTAKITAAVDDTTTDAAEPHLLTTDAAEPVDATTDAAEPVDPTFAPVSAAPRAGGLGPVLLAISVLLLVGQGCATSEDTTTDPEGLHLSTTDGRGPAPVSAALRADTEFYILLLFGFMSLVGTLLCHFHQRCTTTDDPSPAPVPVVVNAVVVDVPGPAPAPMYLTTPTSSSSPVPVVTGVVVVDAHV